jgi:hypothetical protein
VWWHEPVIPAIQEVQVGGHPSKDGQGKCVRFHLKNRLKTKRARWLKFKYLKENIG